MALSIICLATLSACRAAGGLAAHDGEREAVEGDTRRALVVRVVGGIARACSRERARARAQESEGEGKGEGAAAS